MREPSLWLRSRPVPLGDGGSTAGGKGKTWAGAQDQLVREPRFTPKTDPWGETTQKEGLLKGKLN